MKDIGITTDETHAHYTITHPKDLSKGHREELINFRNNNPHLHLVIQLDKPMRGHLVDKKGTVTAERWLEMNGFTFFATEIDEGIRALNRALRTYGEQIKNSMFFQHYLEIVMSCYNPYHPGYKDAGAKGASVDARWLKDFAEFVRDALHFPGVDPEDVQAWFDELLSLSPELRRKLRPN